MGYRGSFSLLTRQPAVVIDLTVESKEIAVSICQRRLVFNLVCNTYYFVCSTWLRGVNTGILIACGT